MVINTCARVKSVNVSLYDFQEGAIKTDAILESYTLTALLCMDTTKKGRNPTLQFYKQRDKL